MDDIYRLESKLDIPVGREMEFIRGHDLVVGIPELPPPLMPNHCDTQRILHGLHEQRLCAEGPCRKEQNDQRGDDRPCNLDRPIAMNLQRYAILGSPPVAHDRIDQQALDDDKDERRHDEDHIVKVEDILRATPLRRERSLWPIV